MENAIKYYKIHSKPEEYMVNQEVLSYLKEQYKNENNICFVCKKSIESGTMRTFLCDDGNGLPFQIKTHYSEPCYDPLVTRTYLEVLFEQFNGKITQELEGYGSNDLKEFLKDDKYKLSRIIAGEESPESLKEFFKNKK